MRYKIILVPFPFDDLRSTKVRPAVCLSEQISSYNHVVIAFITSQIQRANEDSDLYILNSDPDFAGTGLMRSSAIRLHRLVTIPIDLIRRELGVLPDAYHSHLKTKLKSLFDLE
ncbi:MAG: type II toxin-antitoxin system PemK/MazF family toxin [Microscillaceae bacterium]|nr:type II toxin-antitoxin system PemK/MazF family toxin [Microscillaceae bacterium]